jgi:glycosyltransferase involved in cell wall biosynthesis
MGELQVLQVCPGFAGAWGYGGIPRVAAALSKGLSRRGHRITVCTTDACDAGARLADDDASAVRLRPWPLLERDGLELRVFPNLSNRLAYHLQFFQPLGLRRFLRAHAHRFDVAHLHGHHHLPGAIAASELRRAGVPYLVAPNGTAPRIERRRLAKRLFDHTLGRGVLAGAGLLLAVTDAERAQLEALGIAAERIRLVPNPLDLREFEPAPRRPPAASGSAARVAYLGQLAPRKRVDVLLRALAMLPEATSLVVAGGGGCERRLRALARRLRIASRVRFAGLLRGRERLELLAAVDAVAYAGSDEIFGLVPLEALLCGTPVVVADDSGCGEVIRDVGGGLRVPPGDAAALARALAGLLADAEGWRDRALRSAAEIRRRFASEVVAAGCERVYAEAIAQHEPAREARRWTRPVPA